MSNIDNNEPIEANPVDNNESIEVDLSDDDKQLLIFAYVKQHMRPESCRTFHEVLDLNTPIQRALEAAVINEMINNILEEYSRLAD